MVNDVAGGKLSVDVFHGNAHLHHQHHSVVGQVCQLVDGLLFVVGLTGDNHLGAFLTHLFQDLVDALFKEVGGVGALGTGLVSAYQHIVQPLEAELTQTFAFPKGIGKAGVGAGMAGRAVLFHYHNQGILIAVRGDGYDVLVVAAGLTLEPQLVPGTAPEAGEPLFHGNFKAFLVHVGQGQYFFRDAVHHDGGNQALFVKFQFVDIDHMLHSHSGWNPVFVHFCFQVGDLHFTKVENAGGKTGVHLGQGLEEGDEIVNFACTAGSDHGHGYHVAHLLQHFQVKALLHTVGIDGVHHNFPGTPVHTFLDPLDGFHAGVFPAALGKNAEHAVHTLYVHGKHHALIAVNAGCFVDEGRVADGAGIDAHLIGTAAQHPFKILHGIDAAAHR